MLTKLLKICGLPSQKKYIAGINLKGEYLKDYGFKIGDYVQVVVTENKIVITKDSETNVISLLSRNNKVFDQFIETFDLALPEHE